MKFDREELSNEQLIKLYEALLLPRLIEDKMLILLRQGKVSKWFSGIGQEAISVGIAEALNPEEYIFPLHRNLGIFTSRKLPLAKLFAQLQGKKSGFSKGRERSFHFGTNEHHVVGMISHLGPQMALANGVALSNLINNKAEIAVAFTGDGGSSEGDFHEALNVAAVWNLPVLFVVENNGYGLSTPSNEQFKFKQFIDKGIGYGMETVQVDGNNILEVYNTVSKISKSMRDNPRPILMECITFRMRGHEEASGTKYVPKELLEEWGLKDPIANYEQYLLDNKLITADRISDLRTDFIGKINDGLAIAFAEDDVIPNTEEEVLDVFAPFENALVLPIGDKKEMRLIDAISEALDLAMQKNPELVLMGQDIAEYGGVFKITQGFVEKYGKARVRNTPLCESAILGAGLGLSIKGQKAMVEMQFADFVTVGFNQIINNLAKSHYRWGQNADVVVRMPTGAGVGAGPFHSQSNEAWFFHTPGLRIAYPSTPEDAKGMLLTAFEDPNPYLFFEHKALYRSVTGLVPEGYYNAQIGSAKLVTEGDDLTIITYGQPVIWLENLLKEENINADLIDLRWLAPWDKQKVFNSVKKTGKVFAVTEDNLTGSIMSEIVACIAEECFNYLDAPILREGSLDTPVPFSTTLENNFLPKNRLKEKIFKLINY